MDFKGSRWRASTGRMKCRTPAPYSGEPESASALWGSLQLRTLWILSRPATFFISQSHRCRFQPPLSRHFGAVFITAASTFLRSGSLIGGIHQTESLISTITVRNNHWKEAPLHQPPACSQHTSTILSSTPNSALYFYSQSAFIDIHMLIQGEPSDRCTLRAQQELWGRQDAHSGAAGRKPTRFSALRKQTNNYMSTMRRWTAINRCCSEEIDWIYRFCIILFVKVCLSSSGNWKNMEE